MLNCYAGYILYVHVSWPFIILLLLFSQLPLYFYFKIFSNDILTHLDLNKTQQLGQTTNWNQTNKWYVQFTTELQKYSTGRKAYAKQADMDKLFSEVRTLGDDQ